MGNKAAIALFGMSGLLLLFATYISLLPDVIESRAEIKINYSKDKLIDYLSENGIPSMIYYPIPLYKQEAFNKYVVKDYYLTNTEDLAKKVISLPIHTEIDSSNQEYIIDNLLNFFK